MRILSHGSKVKVMEPNSLKDFVAAEAEKMIEINTMWYKHIQECGIQCQISFHFIKQLFDEYIHPFTEIPFL